jgi:RNA recognition motif-containing protein
MSRSVIDSWSSSCFTLYAGNLDTSVGEDMILKIFEQFGTITFLDCPTCNKESKFCFITYERWESVVLAADNLNGIVIQERILKVEPAPKYRK